MSLLPKSPTPAKTNVHDFSMLIYGPAKIGKTTFCSQAKDVLFLATEPGLKAITACQSPVTNWQDFLICCTEINEGKHQFKTIVIDTIDNAYRYCTQYICAKHGVDHESDLPFGKGYGLVGNEFHRVLTKLAFMPYSLMMVSHANVIEMKDRSGNMINTKIVPALSNGPRKLVTGLVDLILYCDFKSGEKGESVRVMHTKPGPNFDAGDRTGCLPPVMKLDYSELKAGIEMYADGAN